MEDRTTYIDRASALSFATSGSGSPWDSSQVNLFGGQLLEGPKRFRTRSEIRAGRFCVTKEVRFHLREGSSLEPCPAAAVVSLTGSDLLGITSACSRARVSLWFVRVKATIGRWAAPVALLG